MGYPEGQCLEYHRAGDGNFGFLYPHPPDTVVNWRAPTHSPGQSPPVERSLWVTVHDGLGGDDLYGLGPILVFERPDPCFCGGSYPTFGDITCDGAVNPVDVAIIVNYVYRDQDQRCYPAQWSCAVDLGDVDCDATIGPMDDIYYVNFVYKNITPFPCDSPCD